MPVVTCRPVSSVNTPDRIFFTSSGSRLCVVEAALAGLRRSRSAWISSAISGRPAGSRPPRSRWRGRGSRRRW